MEKLQILLFAISVAKVISQPRDGFRIPDRFRPPPPPPPNNPDEIVIFSDDENFPNPMIPDRVRPTPPPPNYEEEMPCRETLLALSGWFASQLYPENYPDGIECEWVIRVNPGNVIEIKFTDLDLGPPSNGGVADGFNDYVTIFDADDESTRQNFNRFSSNPWSGPITYRSKSNVVRVQFSTDGFRNFKGFNATYDSWDAVQYCDKNELAYKGRVDPERTNCRNELRNGFYKTCFVSCYPHYVLRRSAKVTCRNGSFFPEHPCRLIAWEVQLCEITNLHYCRYGEVELADYWAEMYRDHADFSPIAADEDDSILMNLDLFPDPHLFKPILPTALIPGGGPVVSGFIPPTETRCIDSLLKYSYCIRKKNNDYAFSCNAFMKIKKLAKDVGQRKMKTCFQCRAIDCTNVVYI